MKKRNPYLAYILIVGIVLLMAFIDRIEFLKPIKNFVFLIWIPIVIWDIIERLKYRNGSQPNILRIQTNNDDYSRIFPFIFGTFLIIAGYIALNNLESEKTILYSLILTGILYLITGLLFVPTGIIEYKNDALSFANGNNKHRIKINKIDRIELKSNDLIIVDKNQKKYYVSFLNLIESDYQKISEFLNQRIENKIEIKKCYNKV